MNLEKLNQQIAGTGFQFAQTKTKIRVENEDGLLLFYTRNINHTLKKIIPHGCGGISLESLQQIASD